MHKTHNLRASEICTSFYPFSKKRDYVLIRLQKWKNKMNNTIYECVWKDRNLALVEMIIVGDTLFACMLCQNEVIVATHLEFDFFKCDTKSNWNQWISPIQRNRNIYNGKMSWAIDIKHKQPQANAHYHNRFNEMRK